MRVVLLFSITLLSNEVTARVKKLGCKQYNQVVSFGSSVWFVLIPDFRS